MSLMPVIYGAGAEAEPAGSSFQSSIAPALKRGGFSGRFTAAALLSVLSWIKGILA